MILESRSLIFSDEELIIALHPLLEAKGIGTQTSIKDVSSEVNSDGEVAVAIEAEGQSEAIIFIGKEVGVAVLNHCIDRGIPLPRGSYKELAIRGDHVALIVRMETQGTMNEVDEGDE